MNDQDHKQRKEKMKTISNMILINFQECCNEIK